MMRCPTVPHRVVGALESAHALVGVDDGVLQLSSLGSVRADLAVVPATDDGLAVGHEGTAEALLVDGVARLALLVGHLDTQNLLHLLEVPHADVIGGRRAEELAEVSGEAHVVDLVKVAALYQRWGHGVLGAVVLDQENLPLRGAGVHVEGALGALPRHRQRRHGPRQLAALHILEGGQAHQVHCAVAAAHHEILEGCETQAEHAHLDQRLWPPLPVQHWPYAHLRTHRTHS